ncbi:PAS domain-containing sensor histidine kinase [Chamaesiphon sp. OTE_20_metabat_361]|uniref:sensor histidine kinase n=1 Tax=Chamaesiphon sp. OTE_20_metabat_361 TaxID=2964689 RepID=UPI00286C5307|nr:PAS domain-containing sensor histidine kinase [Chamaesiphon sp. OTE_20_metabat_361]
MNHSPDNNADRYPQIVTDPIERYQTLIQGVAAILWETDARGEVQAEIPQWSAFTGQPLESIQRGGWLNALHPEDRDRVRLAWQTAVERAAMAPTDHMTFEAEYRLHHRDDYYRWMRVHGVPVFDPDGTVQKWMGFHTDIDDRKNAELAAKDRAAEIQRLNTLLTQMMALVDRREREIDQFTYTISHDLKAPLRAVTNLSQWIEDDLIGELAQQSSEQLQLLRTRVGRMEALIDGLLFYSRISRMEVNIERVTVVKLVSDVVALLAPPAGFTIEIDPGLPILDTKRWSLQQVFSQLIDNAIAHHHRDDGNIQISSQPLAEGYEFTITDDGPGIPPAQHEFVFGIFNTLGKKADRTGMGLAIVKKIVETEGGNIELSSDLGAGTQLRFTWLTPVATELSAA